MCIRECSEFISQSKIIILHTSGLILLVRIIHVNAHFIKIERSNSRLEERHTFDMIG